MNDTKASLRFDHREIAVIFSLFIFVSLLMFTVGILVGKGLAQAKYETALLRLPPLHAESPIATEPVAPAVTGTSVSTDAPNQSAQKNEPAAHEKTEIPAAAVEAKVEAKPEAPTESIDLVPKNTRTHGVAGTSLREQTSPEAEDLLKNPKIRGIVDNDSSLPPDGFGDLKKRKVSALPPAEAMTGSGAATGAYTVQVGSYPTEKDAAERVENLKKLGFSHAYFSAKQWSDTKETWYRVWLGYYPDYESAKDSGRALQQRGEVTNYLVRKTDSTK